MITTKGRYALRVMIDLAEHGQAGYIPLKDISARQEISKKYLEIIMRDLVAGRLVNGASGKGGGYRLSRRPEEYTVYEILRQMEGTLSPVACLADAENRCPRREQCLTLPLWTEYDALTRDFFSRKTLDDLIPKGEDAHGTI